jgi:hypothetical protein
MSGTAPILEEIAADFENAPWPEPNLDFLHRTASPPPPLPVVVFRDWAGWIENAAEATNAPVDYVALPLIVAASSLTGNARWAEAWPGWAEPPILWGAAVGDPSSGKTSGAGPIIRDVLGEIEQYVARGFPEALRQWTATAEIATAIEEQWRKEVARAVKNGSPPPGRPDAATPPPKPDLPRIRVIDATIEKLAEIVASTPKGVVCFRDELAAWLLNLQRYANGGSDRPF